MVRPSKQTVQRKKQAAGKTAARKTQHAAPDAWSQYEARKAALLAQLQAAKGPVSLHKSTSNLFRERQNASTKIDVREFNHVLSIDVVARTADVEGMTTYETLVKATLAHNLVAGVVPELKSITVGGAFSGVGIETSSFKHGFVHETFLEIDVLLPDGNIVTASPTQHSDLFYGFPNTYGTLGYVLRAKLKLFPAKPYVNIVRKRYNDAAKVLKDMAKLGLEQRTKTEWDFMETLVFGPKEYYLTLGKWVDSAPYVSDYTYMNIYYKSIPKKAEDYLSAHDYLFRYDTDWFWSSKYLGLENPLFRFLVGRRNLRSDKYWKVARWANKNQLVKSTRAAWVKITKNRNETLIQDAEVPTEQALEFIEWFNREVGMTPYLFAPVQSYDASVRWTMSPIEPGKQYMNVGFYAPLPTTMPDGHYNKLIEKKLLQMHVRKLLYSVSFFTKREFWSLYNKNAYTALKKTYDPSSRLLGLYEKCVKK